MAKAYVCSYVPSERTPSKSLMTHFTLWARVKSSSIQQEKITKVQISLYQRG